MKLGEMLEKMPNSDRLIVQEEDGEELYRGYVANFIHCDVDRDSEVKRSGIATDIFKKSDREIRMMDREKVIFPADGKTDFRFQDLEFMIYTRITIDKKMS